MAWTICGAVRLSTKRALPVIRAKSSPRGTDRPTNGPLNPAQSSDASDLTLDRTQAEATHDVLVEDEHDHGDGDHSYRAQSGEWSELDTAGRDEP